MKTVQHLAALRLGVLGLSCLVVANLASAQTSSTPARNRIITIGYMKPAAGKAAEYVKLEREKWKLIHQDNVNRGRLTSWKLYAVSWPNGEGQEYDYVTVMEYPSFAHLDGAYVAADIAKVLGGEGKFDELFATTLSARQLRRTDTLTVLHTTDGWSTATNRVIAVHYLRSLPGKGEELLKIQREYYLPTNNELIKTGHATGWAVTAVRYPQQLDFPYNYVALNGYESLAQMEKEVPQSWRDKWSSQAKEATKQLPPTRKRVKGELWRLIDQTTPGSSKNT